MSKLKERSIKFNYAVDDVFIILMDQKSSEFTFIHNNDFKCNCSFCVAFQKAILNVDDNVAKILNKYGVRYHKHKTKDNKR